MREPCPCTRDPWAWQEPCEERRRGDRFQLMLGSTFGVCDSALAEKILFKLFSG